MNYNQQPSYEMYQQQPQSEPNLGLNPLINSLAKGLVQRKIRERSGNPIANALAKLTGKNPGTGITTPLTGGVEAGSGISDTASLAGAGTQYATNTLAPGIAGAGSGAVENNFGSGGYLDSTGRATDTGFGDTGAGGGLRASDSGPGMTVSEQNSIQYSPATEGGTGTASTGGAEAEGGGGSWGAAAGGALSGYNAGMANYRNDPNMTNKKDGFGTKHADYRAGAGGATLGGVMGYFGGPIGSMLAGPVVQAVHPYAEALSRGMVETGSDLTGDSTGAMMLDPIATVASGKYSNSEILGDGLRFGLAGPLGRYLR